MMAVEGAVTAIRNVGNVGNVGTPLPHLLLRRQATGSAVLPLPNLPSLFRTAVRSTSVRHTFPPRFQPSSLPQSPLLGLWSWSSWDGSTQTHQFVPNPVPKPVPSPVPNPPLILLFLPASLRDRAARWAHLAPCWATRPPR